MSLGQTSVGRCPLEKRVNISSYLGYIIPWLGSVKVIFGLVIVAPLENSLGKSLIGTITEIHVLLYVLLQEPF